ncbi:carboxypeptidase-like regulatory domain-containing protein [Hymenobacter sp. BRD67]|uniref:carboxypeptidase-like regulatory domain-containing protein n=1 Tax=Hymenobacter sp. BRD67 TaxID=2675877 RepID=UPI001565474C|nr:carboxypeptidase-like regulatory domain-containing protein [Hymenobacter sp. BRD67]QKG53309.1 carboxypeptidase regulatory-like domain-containing protein [Hymenobacter sp. BRD67]
MQLNFAAHWHLCAFYLFSFYEKSTSTPLHAAPVFAAYGPFELGQGATTASLSGAVTDAKGEPLPGATVLAVHTPTNTQYGVGTNADGRYNIQGMRVGGPYTVKVTFVGYQDVVKTGIILSLGENKRIDAPMSTSTTELGEVTITTRRDPVINAGRTGAETNVSREQISQLPTLSRSLTDFTRLTPQAGGAAAHHLAVPTTATTTLPLMAP